MDDHTEAERVKFEAASAVAQAPTSQWVLESGAVDLPAGHPSRLTVKTLHASEDEANAAGEAGDFNFTVYRDGAEWTRECWRENDDRQEWMAEEWWAPVEYALP